MTSPRGSARTARCGALQAADTFHSARGSRCTQRKAARAGAPSCGSGRGACLVGPACARTSPDRSRTDLPVALVKAKRHREKSHASCRGRAGTPPRALRADGYATFHDAEHGPSLVLRGSCSAAEAGDARLVRRAHRRHVPIARHVLPSTSLRLLVRDAATLPGDANRAGSSFSTTVTGHEHA